MLLKTFISTTLSQSPDHLQMFLIALATYSLFDSIYLHITCLCVTYLTTVSKGTKQDKKLNMITTVFTV